MGPNLAVNFEGKVCFLASSNMFAWPAPCSVDFGRETSGFSGRSSVLITFPGKPSKKSPLKFTRKSVCENSPSDFCTGNQ